MGDYFRVYNNWAEMEDVIQKIVDENKEDHIIIGGDFNARIGETGDSEEEERSIRRKNKDKKVNDRGKALLRLVDDIGGYIGSGKKFVAFFPIDGVNCK